MSEDLESYVCKLDTERQEQAKRELNETAKERVAAMRSFREWILQQKNWLKCPTDAHQLLMFLRNKKFVQLKAREKLIRYWTAHTNHPQWFQNQDTRDPKAEMIMRDGLIILLPGYDSQGRRVTLARWGMMDTTNKRYSVENVMKVLVMLDEYLLMDEQTQVAGWVIFEDFTGFSLQHSAFLGIENSRKMASVFTKAFPLRFKGIHTYNQNPVFEALLSAVKPFLAKKVMSRFQFHGKSLSTVYEHVDKHLLPVEYLPDEYKGPHAGTVADLIAKTVSELQKPEVHDYLMHKSTSGYGVDESKRPPDSELFNESFLRLNVD